MRVAAGLGDALAAVGLVDEEALLAVAAVRRQGEPRRVSSMLSYQTPIFTADLAGLVGGGDLAAELAARAHGTLDLLDGGAALPVDAPEVVLVADADVLAQHGRHGRQRDQAAHARPEGHRQAPCGTCRRNSIQ
ncbi:MAG: hypothetical protein U1E14_03755 [Geminicoccaceae bacterium]